MGLETGETGRAVLLNDGRRLYLRKPAREDLSRLALLDGAPFAYAVWGAGSSSRVSLRGVLAIREHREPDIVAALAEGLLVAASWLYQDDEDPATGNFGLAIQPAFSRSGIAPALLRELAEHAILRGVRRMRSCVGQGTRDPLSDCRGAGLPVLSAMTFGGVTELVLGAYRVREAAVA